MKACNITTIDASNLEKTIWKSIDDKTVKLDIDFLELAF